MTRYLDREAVEGTLRKSAGIAAGSIVAFAYLASEPIEARSLYWRYARAVIKLTGEPWVFGIDNTLPVRGCVATFFASCGPILEERRNFGPETSRKRTPVGFDVPIVQPASTKRHTW